MSIEFRTDVPENAQESSFMNATLQTTWKKLSLPDGEICDGVAYSIAVYVEIAAGELPDDFAAAQQLVEARLREMLAPLVAQPGVTVEIEIGPDGND